MNHLNKAYEKVIFKKLKKNIFLNFLKLRNVLPPNVDEGRRLSKFETLLCAQEYIKVLSNSLGLEEKDVNKFKRGKEMTK